MAEINVGLINPFLMAATGIIRDTAQVELQVGKPFVKTSAFDESMVIIMIGITGEIRGHVIIAIPHENALSLASKMMMGMPVTELDELSVSAISELGNMIMGNAATLLADKGIGIDITPPTLCEGTLSITQSYAKNICVPLTSEEFNIELDIAIKSD